MAAFAKIMIASHGCLEAHAMIVWFQQMLLTRAWTGHLALTLVAALQPRTHRRVQS